MPFLDENDNEVIRNVKDPHLFIDDSFQIIPMAVGIKFIVGRLRDQEGVQSLLNPGKLEVQGVKFEKPDWSMESALEWLGENMKNFTVKCFKKISEMKTKSISGVEIFSAGVWNGDKYTTQDLDEMVKAFEETKESVRPFLKLGHASNQKILQEEGLPAAGWIEKVYRKGDKLIADFTDIPDQIFNLIAKKAYRKVSSEIYLGVKIADKAYKFMLGAVALLGAETPGVMNLKDIIAMYGLKGYDSIKSYAQNENDLNIKEYEYSLKKETPKMSKTEKEIELELKLKEAQEKLNLSQEDAKQFKSDLEGQAAKLEEVEAQKAEAEKKVFAAEVAAAEAEMDKDLEKMIGDKLITKGMKPFVQALLQDEPEAKMYSLKAGDKDVEFDKKGLVTEIAKMFSKMSDVNLDESSLDGDQDSHKQEISEKDIEQYAADNKVDFASAYKAICAGKLEVTQLTEED